MIGKNSLHGYELVFSLTLFTDTATTVTQTASISGVQILQNGLCSREHGKGQRLECGFNPKIPHGQW